MDKRNIGKIISGTVGLALVITGAVLAGTQGEHSEALIMAGLAILGGLGTMGLPRLREPSPAPAPGEKPSGGGPGGVGPALALLAALSVTAPALVGCSGTAAAIAIPTVAAKVRDLGCGGMRIAARVTDRACRVSGGPWVVPRSEAEVAEDASARLLSMPRDEADDDEADTSGGEEPSE